MGKRKVSSLKPHPISSQIYELYDIEGLKESIRQLGLLESPIVDQHGHILSGNRRMEAIRQLGWEEVEVKQVKVKDKDIGYLLFSHNRTRVKSMNELLNEIGILRKHFSCGAGKRGHLKNGGPIDWRSSVARELNISTGQLAKIIKIGRDPFYVEAIVEGKLTINQAFTDLDRKEKQDRAIRASCNTKNVTLTTDDVKIYTKSSNDMSEIEDGQVQMIFTSPPYWNKRDYGVGGLGTEKTPEEFVDNLVRHFDDCYRVLNKRGSFYLNVGDTYLNGRLQNIPHQVVLEMIKRKGWILRNTIIWRKTNPMPSGSKNNLTSSYEFIFVLVKSDSYYYNSTPLIAKGEKKVASIPNHRSKPKETLFSPIVSTGTRNLGDYWCIDVVTTAVANQSKSLKLGLEHPAIFPPQIVELPILQTTEPGDWILDPFMGSGTVLTTALDYGRRTIGYDSQPNFTARVIQRLKNMGIDPNQLHA